MPGPPRTVRIAILGLGEAGSEICRDLVAAGARVRAYDPAVSSVPAGADPATDEADAARDADIVLSVNSAQDAAEALRHGLPGLRAGAVWAVKHAERRSQEMAAACELLAALGVPSLVTAASYGWLAELRDLAC